MGYVCMNCEADMKTMNAHVYWCTECGTLLVIKEGSEDYYKPGYLFEVMDEPVCMKPSIGK